MLKKVIKYCFLFISGLVLITLVYLFSPGLWNRWFIYPKLEKQLEAFHAERKETPVLTELNTYRGALHVHSYWSHDSEGTLARIIPAAKKTGIDFIFLTDHAHGNIDSFPRGYHGYYDGVLIESGTEKQGFCTWPLDSIIIDWRRPKDSIVKEVVSGGGMLFYAHSEEAHNWSNPWYQGMEIYNIHTDTKDESLPSLLFNLMASGSQYRHWAMREIFDEQHAILARWDSLNQQRQIVGFAAVDAHENQNIRARYLRDGRVEWLGPNADPIDTVKVSVWNRWMFNDPDEEGWIFKWLLDTYETSFHYVTNYVMADTLSVASIAAHLKKGNLFVAFQNLGDASGFMFCAKDASDHVSAIMGDSVRLADIKSLQVVSPLPGQFRLIRNGKTVDVSSDDSYQYILADVTDDGIYRIEVHIQLDGKYVPWIYSNPIYIY